MHHPYYGVPFWSPHLKNELEKIQKMGTHFHIRNNLVSQNPADWKSDR